MELTWQDFQKMGDSYYNKGNVTEAKVYWKFADSMRPDIIGKQMDIMNTNQQINKHLVEGVL